MPVTHDDPLKKPWDQLPGESDPAYQAFREYLVLPKRLGTNRRVLQDLADKRINLQTGQVGVRIQTISHWHRKGGWNWDERAQAWDEASLLSPIAALQNEHMLQFIVDLRGFKAKLIDGAERILKGMDVKKQTAGNAASLLRLAIEVEEKAQRLEQPRSQERVEALKTDVRKLYDTLVAGGFGQLAAGSVRGVVKATERTIEFGPDESAERSDDAVREVSAVPGEVCEGSPGPESDEPADRDSADSGEESGCGL